jgi:predicted HAD superfamily Cof-like phosphohydrolase
MTNVEKDLLDFHNKFAVFMRDTPGFLDEDLMKFRIGFIEEEFNELKKAVAEEDLVEVADALVDIVYVAAGMATIMGIPFSKVWDEVQRSNMAKVSGKEAMEKGIETKKPPRHPQDVLKPLDWEAPRIKEILDEAM